MKLGTFLIALTLLPCSARAANKDKENKELLTQVSRIFVAGDDKAADTVRDRIGRANACFVLADTRQDSDAVFYLIVPGEVALGQSLQGGEGVLGELKKDGNRIWTSEASLISGASRSAAVNMAAVSLVNSLERDARCGKKKAALAQGNTK